GHARTRRALGSFAHPKPIPGSPCGRPFGSRRDGGYSSSTRTRRRRHPREAECASGPDGGAQALHVFLVDSRHLSFVAPIDIVNPTYQFDQCANSRWILPECKVKKGKKPKPAT